MKRLLFVSVVLSLFSCSRISDNDAEVLSSSSDNYISLSEAVKIAARYSDQEDPASRANASLIKEAFSLQDDNSEPFLHIVNFEKGGYLVVSGDNRTEPILAYSECGSWKNNPENYPFGLKLWIDQSKNMISELRMSNAVQSSIIRKKWRQMQGTAITRSQTPESGIAVEVDSTVGPLINDHWHRYQPYNDSLSLLPHGSIYIKPTVGCVPLSIARIVRYHSYPTTYPWSSILDNGSSSPATKQYIKNVFDNVKSYCDSYHYLFYQEYAYGYWNTYVDKDMPIPSLLNARFGNWEGDEMDFDPSNISDVYVLKNELLNHSHPVIIAGRDTYGRHMWVCDGCHYKVEIDYDDFNQPHAFIFIFIHNRWGEIDNEYDGWFNYYNMTAAGTQNFNNDMTLSYNLYPL